MNTESSTYEAPSIRYLGDFATETGVDTVGDSLELYAFGIDYIGPY